MKLQILSVIVAGSLVLCSCGNQGGEDEKEGGKEKKELPDQAKNQKTKELDEKSQENKSHAQGNAPDKPIHLDSETFKEQVWDYEQNPQQWVYKGDKPAIVDFHAVWCGPCKVMNPIIDDMAKKYAGQVVFYKVDVDKQPELAGIFRVQGIPTFLIIKPGDQPSAFSGALSGEQLEEIVVKLIDKG